MTRFSNRLFVGTLLGIVLIVCLLPLVIYGLFPTLVTPFVIDALTAHGLRNVQITVQRPGLQQLIITQLAFDKPLASHHIHVTLDEISIDYEWANLMNGRLNRIDVHQGHIDAKPIERTEQPALPVASPAPPASDGEPLMTVAELFAPFPLPPVDEFQLGEITIVRRHAIDALHHVRLRGSTTTTGGRLASRLHVEGDQIPAYELTVAATSLGDADFSLQSPSSLSAPLLHLTSHSRHAATGITVSGSLEADLDKVTTFLALLFPLDQDLARLAGHARMTWSGTLPASRSLHAVTATDLVALTGTFDAEARLPHYRPFATDIDIAARGTFASDNEQLTWMLSESSHATFRVPAQALQLPPALQEIIPTEGHAVSVSFPRPLQGRASLAGDADQLSVDGQLQMEYTIDSVPVQFRASLRHLSGRFPSTFRGRLRFDTSGRLSHQQVFAPITQVQWNTSGQVSFDEQQASISFNPQTTLTADLLPINDIHMPHMTVTFPTDLSATYDLRREQWTTNAFTLGVIAPRVSVGAQPVEADILKVTSERLHGSAETWYAQGALVVLGLTTTISDTTPPATNWKVGYAVTPNAVSLKFLAQTTDRFVSLRGALQHTINQQTGRLRLTLDPVAFGADAFKIHEAVTPWPYPVEVTAGSMSAASELSWDLRRTLNPDELPLTAGRASVTLDGISGTYDALVFSGFDTMLTFAHGEPWTMPEHATMTLETLETGVTLSDLLLEFHLTPRPNTTLPFVTVSRLSARIFDGTLSTDGFTFDPTRAQNELTLHAHGLDLAKILEVEQQEGLQGSGLLDGSIPIRLHDAHVEVTDGLLEARPPGGTLRYQTEEATADALEQTSEHMNLVIQTLQNFQYEVLKVTANYETDGTLLLATTLQGQNPDLGKNGELTLQGVPVNLQGKPIHFNLNIEENIPALLKSLRLAQGIEDRLEHLLQESQLDLLQQLGE